MKSIHATRMAMIAVLWGGVLACDGVGNDSVATGDVTLSDSSGLRVVRFSDFGALQLSERPAAMTVEVGRQQGYELHQVTAARILDSGRLAVANSGTSEVLYFDQVGRLESKVGGPGNGPGEYRVITAFPDAVGDTLTVYDTRHGRLTVLDPEGDVVRTMGLDPPSLVVDLLPLAMDGEGRVLAVHGDSRIFAGSGVRQETVPLLVIDSTMKADTIALWPGREWSFTRLDNGWFRTEVGFSRSVESSGRDGRAVVGSTDRLELSVVKADGTAIMHIEATGPNRVVTAADVDRWRAARLMSQPDDLSEIMRMAIESAPSNQTYPAFSGLLLDADGRIWIGATEGIESPDRTWAVLAPDGTPSFRIVLPASAKPLDAVRDLVVVLDKTDLDEEVLRWVELGPTE